MKKCDIRGCKEHATVFGKMLSFCQEHWDMIVGVFKATLKSASTQED